MFRRLALPLGMLTLPCVLLLAVACGSSNTNAATSRAQATGTPAPVGQEIASDNKFSVVTMTATAGKPQTLTLVNKGQAVHNWTLLNVNDAAGKAVTTQLLDAGKTGSVTFTIAKAGTYDFQCAVHPTEMKGTLIVAP